MTLDMTLHYTVQCSIGMLKSSNSQCFILKLRTRLKFHYSELNSCTLTVDRTQSVDSLSAVGQPWLSTSKILNAGGLAVSVVVKGSKAYRMECYSDAYCSLASVRGKSRSMEEDGWEWLGKLVHRNK